MSWFDPDFDLIHLDENPEVLHDNAILWTAEYQILTNLLSPNHVAVVDENFYPIRWNKRIQQHLNKDNTYRQAPWLPDDPASHDNVTAIACMSYVYNLEYHKHINIWEGRLFHPRDVFFYSALNSTSKPIRNILLFPVILIMIVSCIQKYKYRVENGEKKKFVRTDGKLLSFIRCKTLGMHKTFRLLTWIVSFQFGDLPWSSIFATYFGPDHINAQLARDLKI